MRWIAGSPRRAARKRLRVAVEIDTPYGPARAHLYLADEPRGALVLGHGAAGGVGAPDLVAATDAARSNGISVALVASTDRYILA